AGPVQVEQRAPIAHDDDGDRIQAEQKAQVFRNSVDGVEDRGKPEPEEQHDLERLNRIAQEDVQTRSNPAQALGEQQQHRQVEKYPERGQVDAVKHDQCAKQKTHADEMVNEV